MITLNQPSQTILMLTVPEDAKPYLHKWPWLDRYALIYNAIGHDLCEIYLQEGKWKLIGKGDALSEEEWRGVVPGPPFCSYTPQNILDKKCGGVWFATAKESGHSLLASHNLRPETTVFLKLEK